MTSYISLRDRRFDVTSAVVRQFDGLWSVEIETAPREFDGEMWSPRLYHQGLRLLTDMEGNLEGASTSWRNKSDAEYPHPELGLMYVFGHHDVYDTTLAFGRMDAGHIELEWDGHCDVFLSDDFTEAVPFQCRCVASVHHSLWQDAATTGQSFSPKDLSMTNLEKARRALIAANEFYAAGERCAGQSSQQTVEWLAHPEVVNLSFAAEVAMKGLHAFVDSKAWGHDLSRLFDDLPERFQQRICGDENRVLFEERLRCVRDSFDLWRYAYEKQRLVVSLGFLKTLANSAIRVLTEELM